VGVGFVVVHSISFHWELLEHWRELPPF